MPDTFLKSDISEEQLFFSIFCIEALSRKLDVSGSYIYKLLAEKSSILDEYIISCYDALHTQGEEYIVSDLTELMQNKGLL